MIRRMTLLACAGAMALATFVPQLPLWASQNSLQLPTSGTFSGLQFSNKVTDAIDSLVTCNSGTTAPSNAAGGAPKAGQCWIDTTSTTLLKKYRYTGSAWVLEGVLDVTNGIWTPPIGGGSATIASAATTSICGVPQSYVTISGTTTITSFGTDCPAGQVKIVRFSGSLTLTYNSNSLILPAGGDITTAAGDTAIVISEGSGDWRVALYSPATGQAVANPAVPVGTQLNYFGFTAPEKYVLGFGQAISRTDYPDYLAAVTSTQSVTRTSASATLTGFSDTSQFGAGMPVEGTGIPAGTTISSCSGTSCTISANATTTGTSDATVFAFGYGSGGDTLTVGVPDCRGRVVAGRDNMGGTAANNLTSSYFGKSGSILGATGGSETHTLTEAELPEITPAGTVSAPTISITGGTIGGTGGGLNENSGDNSIPDGRASIVATASAPAFTGTSFGSGDAHAIVQPTIVSNCIIRVLP